MSWSQFSTFSKSVILGVRHVAAAHRLLDEHLGEAGGCVAGVVVVAVVHEQRVEHLLDLAGDDLAHRLAVVFAKVVGDRLVAQARPERSADHLVHAVVSHRRLPKDRAVRERG